MQITNSDEINQQDMALQPASEPSPHGQRPKPRRTKPIIIAILILLVIGIVTVVLLKVFGDKNTSETVAPSQTETVKVDPVTRDVPDAVNTETFESATLGIDLSYPNTWKVTEADNGMRIESALFTFKDANQTEIKGNFKIYMRMGARPVDSAYIGRGYAIAPSEKLTYTKPAPGQRTDTLITSFGLDEPVNFAYFMIAGNFQLAIGDTLGPNYAKEADAFVIAGGYASAVQKEDLATTEVSASTYAQTNAYKQAIDILKSIRVH